VATVSYGDRLDVLETRGTWTQASPVESDVKGWIHASALTRKRIVLKSGEEDAALAASSGELALAGKGFNSAVEAEFKTKNKTISFEWVDRMEKIVIPPQDLASFLLAGKVVAAEGADK
jgi:hypothetical protein